VSTGNSTAACSCTLTNGKSAMVRFDISGAAINPTVIAHSGDPTGGLFGAADTFAGFNGYACDPRVNAGGDMAFNAFTPATGSNLQAVLFVAAAPNTTITSLAVSGAPAPGITGDNFKTFERPTLGNGHTVAFRAFTTNNQAVYKGDPTNVASIQPVAVSYDTATQLPGSGIPAGRQLWSIFGPFSNVNGHIAFEASLTDVTTNANEQQAILSDVSGTLKIIAKAGDTSPGVAGDTFATFNMPVIGDGDKVAFTATTAGGKTGLWQYTVGGGVTEVMLIGDMVSLGGSSGNQPISSITIPGGASRDRANETRCIDSAGHILVYVMYQSSQTGLLVTPP